MKRYVNLLIFIFCCTSVGYGGWLKIPFGRVILYKGCPKVNNSTIQLKQRIYVGDIIKTDSNSTLQIKTKKGDTLYIGPNSHIIIKDKTKVKIKSGVFRSIIHKLKPNEAFKVVSGGGVAGVKGTEFIVYSKDNASAFFTKEGVVTLKNLNSAVDILSKEMSQSGVNIAPIQPINYEKDQTLRNMYEMLYEVTGIVVPKEMKKLKELPEIIARWNINYTSYLVDKKQFKEALKYLDIAFLFTSNSDVKAEILFQKSIIDTKFLNNYTSAIDHLKTVATDYKDTKFYEDAIFHLGFIYLEIKDLDMANRYFKLYNKLFPQGKYKNQIKVLINKAKEKKK